MDIPQDRITRFLSRKTGRTLSFVLPLLVLLIFFIQMFGKAYGSNGYDFSSYLLSSRTFFEGKNPYTTGSIFPFIYPLFVCVLLSPLAYLPYWLSNVTWFIINVAALYLVTYEFLKLYSESFTRQEIIALLLIPFVVLIDVIQNNLLNGQINIVVLLLCVLFFKYHLKSRTLLASILLSVAISIKLTPLIFLVYLIVRKEFRHVATTIVMSAVLVVGLPYLVAGQNTFVWYSQYVHSFLVQNIVVTSQATDRLTFSFTSLLSFLFPSMSTFAALAVAGCLSVGPIIWAQASLPKDDTRKQMFVFSLYLLAMVLISPMSETHHLINLLPAIVLVTLAGFYHTKRDFRISVGTLAIVFVSLMTRKVHIATAVIGILTLYGSVIWLLFHMNERSTALFERRTESSLQ